MSNAEVPSTTIDEARNAAVLVAPPFSQEHIAETPYETLSYYERAGILACTSIVWREETIGLALQVEPPNIGLIAAIGGAADRVAIDSSYRITEIEQSAGRRGLKSNQQSEIASANITLQVNQELGDHAREALKAIADKH